LRIRWVRFHVRINGQWRLIYGAERWNNLRPEHRKKLLSNKRSKNIGNHPAFGSGIFDTGITLSEWSKKNGMHLDSSPSL